jgi:aryl-alcohol dehydrogenase-like predicted oxidoreductase
MPEDDWRKGHPDFNEPNLSENLALVERLRTVGKRRGVAPGAVAIAWTLTNPAVTGAIVGARKRQQVDEVVAAAGVRLTQADLTQIQPAAELAGRGQ